MGLAGRLEASGKAAPVPPTLEIAILDPNADPLGNPAVRTRPGVGGNLEVDIPPVILVHRYYYTGDRSFQGPLLPGGPSIVVVNHPKTGERLYVPVQMLPGAPRVSYSHRSIEYDYGKHGITIEFCWLTGRPKVEYRNCQSLSRTLVQAEEKVKEKVKELADRTGLSEASAKMKSVTKTATAAAADRIGELGRMIAAPIAQLGRMIPGVSALNTAPEDQARRLRDSQVRRAEAETEAARKNLSFAVPR